MLKRLPSVFASLCMASNIHAQPEPLVDPLPPIQPGDIVVATREIAQLPRLDDAANAAHANQAHARIQNLVPARDGSADVFVNDLRGVIYRIKPSTQGATAIPYLDLRDKDLGFTNVFHGNESGLAGFAFHPDFTRAGSAGYSKLYVAFSVYPQPSKLDHPGDGDGNHDSVVVECAMNDPASDRFAVASFREVLRVGQRGDTHNVGTIAFNPTVQPGDPDYGMLYASFGDGTGHFDPTGAGQRRDVPNGKIIRIDPLPGRVGKRHAAPRDNPFANEGGARALVFAYGLRHPQHFAWDTDGSHRLFIAEMGEAQIDEINIGVAGGNYGWSRREGTFATGMAVGAKIGPVYPLDADTDPVVKTFLDPVAQYDHDDGKAVGSVVVYRGGSIPALHGKMLCADIVNGRIFYADEVSLTQGKQTPLSELRLRFDGEEKRLLDVTRHSGDRVDLRLGTDANGEVYLLTKSDGKIRRLVPVDER